jgi:hypothetical protein
VVTTRHSEAATPPGGLTLPFQIWNATTTSYFDHDSPGLVSGTHLPFVRFDGASDNSQHSVCTFPSTSCPCTSQPLGYCYDGHDGIDFGLTFNSTVVAAASGVVSDVWNDPGCSGWNVAVWHPALGTSTRYVHLKQGPVVAVNQYLTRGQTIGYSDGTNIPCSNGPHLHFGTYDAWIDRNVSAHPIDPYGWSGSGADPWPYDKGYLWQANAPERAFGNISLLTDPSFEGGYQNVCLYPASCAWRLIPNPSAWVVQTSGGFDGTRYLRFKFSAPGGSVFQDLTIDTNPGDSYSFWIWAKSPDTGCTNFTLSLFGSGITSEYQQTHTRVCGTTWQQFWVPLDAQHQNTFLRAQIYVDDANRYLDVDSTGVKQWMSVNSSFETYICQTGCSGWKRTDPTGGSTTLTRHGDPNLCGSPTTTPHDGPCLLTGRKSGGTGASSIYEDVSITPSAGDQYRFLVWMRLGSPGAGDVDLYLWALGGTSEPAAHVLTHLISTDWVPIPVTLQLMQSNHTGLRAQMYLNTANVDFDFDGAQLYRYAPPI